MLLNRQRPEETEVIPPPATTPDKYGWPHCDIEGRLYCTDKNGNSISLCSTSNFSEQSDNSLKVNNHTVNKDVPENAIFYDKSYDFSEGDENGTFKVTENQTGDIESFPTTQNIKIKGLDTAAYQSSTSFINSQELEKLATKDDLKEVDAISLGGSSLQQILDYIDALIAAK